MYITPINNAYYNNSYRNKTLVKNSTPINRSVPMLGGSNGLTKAELQQIADLKVFNHHIYEFKKGIRSLILTTEKSKYKEKIENKLQKENIDYVIHELDNNNMNVYFGEKPCIDVVRTFDTRLNKLTPEQDFMLGIMLGYDKVKQCSRYLDFRQRQTINKIG